LSLRVRVLARSHVLPVFLVITLTSLILGLILSSSSGLSTLSVSSLLPFESDSFEATGYRAIAIMFDSETCPTCREMRSFWSKIELNPPEGVLATHIMFQSPRGSELFALFRVTQTPTFIILDSSLREIRRYTGAFKGPDIEEAMRSWIMSSLGDGGGVIEGFNIDIIAYPVLGALIALSPCTAPLLVVYVTLLATRSNSRIWECFKCMFLVLAGLMLIGLTLVVSVTLASNIIKAIPVMLSIFIIMMGFLTLLNPSTQGVFSAHTGSRYMICLAYSITAAQCSLPLFTGALLSTIRINIVDSIVALLLLALGLTLTLTLVVITSGRVIERIYAVVGAGRLAIISGVILVTLGSYILVELH